MGDNVRTQSRFTRMSEQMIDYAISLPSDGYPDLDENKVAKKLSEEMQKSEAAAKKVIRLYAPHCKKLLQEIRLTNSNEK